MLALAAAALVFCLLLLAYFVWDTVRSSAELRRHERVRRRLGAVGSAPVVLRGAERRPASAAVEPTLPREEDLFRRSARAARLRYDVSESIAYRLTQANVPFRVGQYVLATSFTSLLFALVMLVAFPAQPLFALLGFLAGIALAFLATRWRLRRRSEEFTAQLPDALTLLASALRTGQALRAGLELVATEMEAPLGTEFAKVVHEVNLGLGEDEALQNLSERLDSVDVQMFVTSVLVQREIGGNLAEILDSARETIRQRFKIQGQVETHTSVARLSGRILIGLPVVLALVVSTIQPGYLDPLVRDDYGRMLLVGAIVAWAVGWLWIRQIMAIRI